VRLSITAERNHLPRGRRALATLNVEGDNFAISAVAADKYNLEESGE
jgi:hypothetical protein